MVLENLRQGRGVVTPDEVDVAIRGKGRAVRVCTDPRCLHLTAADRREAVLATCHHQPVP